MISSILTKLNSFMSIGDLDDHVSVTTNLLHRVTKIYQKRKIKQRTKNKIK